MDPDFDESLPAISDEDFLAVRAASRPYSVAILKVGPNYGTPDRTNPDDPVMAVILRHAKRNGQLHGQFRNPLAVPGRFRVTEFERSGPTLQGGIVSPGQFCGALAHARIQAVVEALKPPFEPDMPGDIAGNEYPADEALTVVVERRNRQRVMLQAPVDFHGDLSSCLDYIPELPCQIRPG